MSGNELQNSSENENLCVVCFKNTEIYSIGICDHPVCFECSTRMRVLCRQHECPICRQDMPKVVFTKTIEPFNILYSKFERTSFQDRKHGLLFSSSDIKKAYDKLLEHRCHLCKDNERSWPFRTFQQLKDHMRRDHELFYCDICIENLKIFTFERRCYTRQELGHHRRKGDPDNTSHRGHPLCEFCDNRYMDSDELFRHLRRTHMFCHFCDADGKHQYYNDIENLVRHFKDEHYLCEEGECKGMPLTAVFRTDIDLKAHIASEHTRHMSKSATKQARTLELEFTLAPRARIDTRNTGRVRGRGDYFNETDNHDIEPGGPGGGSDNRSLFVNPLTPNNFPALGGGGADIVLQRPITTVNFTSKVNSVLNRNDFPSLGSSRYTPNSEVTITTVRGGQQGTSKHQNDQFPALGPPTSTPSSLSLSVNAPDNAAKLSIQVNHKPNGGITTHITTSASTSTQQRPVEAFPALGKATNLAEPQWVKVKSKKHESKTSKVAPTPQLPPSNLEQFPSLSKKSAMTVPTPSTWVNLNNINSTRAEESSAKQVNNNNKTNASDSKQKENKGNKSSKQAADNNKNKDNKENIKTKQSMDKINQSAKGEENAKSTKNKPIESKKSQQDLKQNEGSDAKTKNKKKKDKTNGDSDANSNKETVVGADTNSAKNTKLWATEELEPESKVDDEKEMSTKNGLLETEDFPALGKTNKPPPGFNMKPPPGFTPSSFPPLGGNNLTFTTSRGLSYAVTPSSSYHQPNNFQSRNQNLIKCLMTILNNNDSIKEFKTYSDLFRNGGYPTANYYEHCKTILGDHFDEVFPELLVLLPDIQKQQDLFRFYDGKGKKKLMSCEHCKQIIHERELSEHYNYHVLENQFPTLGKVYQVDNVWKK